SSTCRNPVELGLVASLARPGGNATGLSSLYGPLVQKRLELLKQAAPHTSRVACLYESSEPGSTATMQLIMEAARPLAVTVEASAYRRRRTSTTHLKRPPDSQRMPS